MQISVALFTILIIIPTVFLLIGNYFVTSQEDDIIQDAVRVASLSEQVANVSNSESAWEFYRFGIEFASRQSKIIVVNTDGEILAATKDIDDITHTRIDADFISPVFDGKTSVKLYPKGKIYKNDNCPRHSHGNTIGIYQHLNARR